MRELEEETGLDAQTIQFLGFTSDLFEETGKHHVTLWFEANTEHGEPELHTEGQAMSWFRITELPGPLFGPFENMLTSGLLE